MNTDNFINDAFVREAQAVQITGMSRTTRWRLEQKGEFPLRYQISPGLTAYKRSEIMEWITSRPLEKLAA